MVLLFLTSKEIHCQLLPTIMEYTIAWTNTTLIVSIYNEFTHEKVLKIFLEMSVNENYKTTEAIVLDFTMCKSITLTEKELQLTGSVGKFFSEYNNNKIKFAFIAPQPNYKERINDYNSKYAQQFWERKVFNTIDEAYDWINPSK